MVSYCYGSRLLSNSTVSKKKLNEVHVSNQVLVSSANYLQDHFLFYETVKICI